jgi:hypothetical protein
LVSSPSGKIPAIRHWEVPLGFADLAESIPAAHLDTAAYARAVWAVLNGTEAQIRPERAISGPVQGQAILRVEFASPAPLGNPGPGSAGSLASP